MHNRHMVYVDELPQVYVKDGLVFIVRDYECRVQSPHIAEATSRMVLRALDEWRAESSNVSDFK